MTANRGAASPETAGRPRDAWLMRAPMPIDRQRLRPSPGLGLLAAAITALAGLVPALALVSEGAWRGAIAPGPADLGTLVTALAGPIALVLAAWLLVAILASIAEALVSRRRYLAGHRAAGSGTDWDSGRAWFEPDAIFASSRPSRWARRLAPAVLRHGVAALIGVTLLSWPAVAAGPPAPACPGVAVLLTDGLSAAWPPVRAELSAASEGRIRAEPGYVAEPDHARRIYRSETSAPAQGDGIPGWLPAPPVRRGASGQTPVASGVTAPGADLATVAPTGRRRRLDDDGRLVVQRGDTLWGIAARSLGPGATPAQIDREWPRWFDANAEVIGEDPGTLHPGQRLSPPASVPATRGARR